MQHVESSEPQRFALGTGEMNRVSLSDDDLAELVHDFKSPLATIELEMGLLQERLACSGSPSVRAAMSRIARNVAYIDRLIRDLLDASSIDSGELNLHRQRAELSSIVRFVVDRSVPSRDRARIFLDVPEGVTVDIDELRIERVLANLLSNALKYGDRGSPVIVRLEHQDSYVRVSVIDTGPGIDPDAVNLIFDRYVRTDEARVHDGTGLGLYVAKRIVEAHGGRIGVESIRHVGSSFFFELPA